MRRRRLSRRSSRRIFKRGLRIARKNLKARIMRGGFRL